MTAFEEREIINRVLSGQKNAFDELVVCNQTQVYNLALKMLGNENDALDISQEAFLKAYKSLPSFRFESRFSVWLYRMTSNLCIDHIRRESRITKIPLTHTTDDGETQEHDIPDTRVSPEERAIIRDTSVSVSRAIASLSEKHREILLLREIHGMSYSELSEALRISEGTVKSRLIRAREAVRKILRKSGVLEDGTFSPANRLKDEEAAREVTGDE